MRVGCFNLPQRTKIHVLFLISKIFQNSYSANRGKRDIAEEEEIEDADEITEDEFDELMGRYFNPNGFFFQPGKRSNPNSKSKGPCAIFKFQHF